MNDHHQNKQVENPPRPVIDERLIDINFRALIDLLSYHLYTNKSATIRELLTNANSALAIREMTFGFAQEKPMIRIWLDSDNQQLVIKDNGVGMSKNDLVEYLSTIGSSLTKEISETRRGDRKPFEDLVGRFGIGFLSSFIVASRIVVDTRKPDSPGYRWESAGERSYSVTEWAELSYGTTVMLDLKPEIRREWNEEKIKKMVLENARNFVFPIFWGAEGEEKLNDLQAPWYRDEKLGDEEIEDLREFLTKYDDRFFSAASAPEVIPLHGEDIRGVVYFPTFAAIQHEQVGAIDLYSKRVFVRKDETGIVPPEFPFIKGIVDCSNFQLNAARDDVQSNYKYRYVVEFIANSIMDHLCHLARRTGKQTAEEESVPTANRPERFRLRLHAVMEQFHLLIKRALVQKKNDKEFRFDDHCVSELEEFIPFQSSMFAATTLPEYLTRRKAAGRGKEILFLRPNEDLVAYQAIAEHEKHEFIHVRYEIEEEFLERCAQIIGADFTPAAEVLDKIPKLPATEGWEDIVKYYQERLSHPEFSLSVYLAEFQPDSLPGRMLADKDSEGQRQLQELMEEMGKNKHIDKKSALYKELERVKQKRPHFLYLNKNNPTLKRLAEMRHQQTDINLDLILHPIFHDIAIAANHQVYSGHLTEYQTKVYREMLEGLGARQEIKLAQGKLKEQSKELEEAKAHINSLKTQLNEVRSTSPDLASATTNEVFFIRPMREDHDANYDHISKTTKKICERLKLKLVDPKDLNLPSKDILSDIIKYLRSSRFVVADVSETSNANIYYEAGYVFGTFPEKLILIADKRVIKNSELPFDIKSQRVLEYNLQSVPEFDTFLERFEKMLEEMLRITGG